MVAAPAPELPALPELRPIDLIGNRAAFRWKAHGLECIITPGLVGLAGYVRLPEDHPARHAHRLDVSVPGGLLYGPDGHGWVGFDPAGLGDVWAPPDVASVFRAVAGDMDPEQLARTLTIIARTWAGTPPGVPLHRWTMTELRTEVAALARNLAEQATPPPSSPRPRKQRQRALPARTQTPKPEQQQDQEQQQKEEDR